MKKLFAAILTITTIISFSTCSKRDNETKKTDSIKSKHSVNIEKFASDGTIPELDFKVGDTAKGVKDKLFEIESGKTYEEFTKMILDSGNQIEVDPYADVLDIFGDDDFENSNGYTVITAYSPEKTAYHCAYLKGKENAEVLAIGITGKAFGFDNKTMVSYVKSVMPEKYKEVSPTPYLDFIPDGTKGLEYEFGDYVLQLYFAEKDSNFTTAVLYEKSMLY